MDCTPVWRETAELEMEAFNDSRVADSVDMTKVSIVGAAGTVGAATGYNIALRDIADELVYVDIPDQEDVTVGQAADTNHGVAYDANTTIRQGTYEDTAGSDVVVITAGIPRQPGQTRIDLAGDNAPIMDDIISDLETYSDDFVSITTSNPVDLLNRTSTRSATATATRSSASAAVWIRRGSATSSPSGSTSPSRTSRPRSSVSTATRRSPSSRRSASTAPTPSSRTTRKTRSSRTCRRAP
jgi:hypothetical protein